MTRQPAVAGLFYPGNKALLEQKLNNCFENASSAIVCPHPIALICPHAGYDYSGAGSASAWKSIPEGLSVKTLVLTGPNHTGYGASVSISDADKWSTPLGDIPVDKEAASRLLDAFPEAKLDRMAHLREHSIEVQIPFAQKCLPTGFTILPISLSLIPGDQGYEVCRRLGLALAESAATEQTLFLASTDMSHYISSAAAKEKDKPALDAISSLDAEKLVRVVSDQKISMCGVMAVAVVIEAARRLGATKAELVDYRDSGLVTGDTAKVVSYAAFVLS